MEENIKDHSSDQKNHSNKKWNSYLWEFLMLFLAVFCGFLAENIREKQVERDMEKQYILSLIADLKNDEQVLSQHIAQLKVGVSMIDSMVDILNTPYQIANHTGQLYYLARLAPRLLPLSTNDRTFDQLKNSGNFRLISNLNTSNKIMSYYEKFPLIRLLESVNETEFNEYKKIAAKIFYPDVFLKMEGTNNEITRSKDNPPIRNANNELLKELAIFSIYMHGTKKGILGVDEELRIAGDSLIEYLKKEYRIK